MAMKKIGPYINVRLCLNLYEEFCVFIKNGENMRQNAYFLNVDMEDIIDYACIFLGQNLGLPNGFKYLWYQIIRGSKLGY
jgi:hypothetical protein